jgi:hypothetical protein
MSELRARRVSAEASPPPSHALLSSLLAGRRALVVAEIRELTNQIFPGLVLDGEINGRFPPHAEVLLLRNSRRLEAFAACDLMDTSALRTCHVKFAGFRQGIASEDLVREMMDMIDGFAAANRCHRVVMGLNAARWGASHLRLADKWHIEAKTLCMVRCGVEGEAAFCMDNSSFSSWL